MSFNPLDVTGTSSWCYELLEQDKKNYVRSSDIDTLFTLSKSDYEQLANMELAQLAKQFETENPELGLLRQNLTANLNTRPSEDKIKINSDYFGG